MLKGLVVEVFVGYLRNSKQVSSVISRGTLVDDEVTEEMVD